MEPVVVQRGAVLAGPGEPGGDRAFAVPKHAHGCGDTEPFGQGTQDFCDPAGCRFEAVERRIAPGGEGGLAGLTAKGLDPLDVPMRAIADEGMARPPHRWVIEQMEPLRNTAS